MNDKVDFGGSFAAHYFLSMAAISLSLCSVYYGSIYNIIFC